MNKGKGSSSGVVGAMVCLLGVLIVIALITTPRCSVTGCNSEPINSSGYCSYHYNYPRSSNYSKSKTSSYSTGSKSSKSYTTSSTSTTKKTTKTNTTSSKTKKNSYGYESYDQGYDDVYEDDDYDWDRYWSDDDYADGVDDAMEDQNVLSKSPLNK